MTELNLMNRNV